MGHQVIGEVSNGNIFCFSELNSFSKSFGSGEL